MNKDGLTLLTKIKEENYITQFAYEWLGLGSSKKIFERHIKPGHMLCYATSSTTCFGFNKMNGSRHSSKQEPYLRRFGVNCPTIIENIKLIWFSLLQSINMRYIFKALECSFKHIIHGMCFFFFFL